jgi:hypothetical protein
VDDYADAKGWRGWSHMHDIASDIADIAAAKRSNGVEEAKHESAEIERLLKAAEEKGNDNLPASEWSPTIGQPEAANSKGSTFESFLDSNGIRDEVDASAIRKRTAARFPKTLAYLAEHPAHPDPYTTLRAILDAAFNHAATGKGKERHARDLPFDKQPMLETTRLVGPGFPLGQAIKKAGEAAGMIERGRYDAAEAECLGAINYLAGAVAWMREQREKGRAEYGTGYIPPAPACAGAAA